MILIGTALALPPAYAPGMALHLVRHADAGERDGPVTTIIHDRPEAKNAMNKAAAEAIAAAMDRPVRIGSAVI